MQTPPKQRAYLGRGRSFGIAGALRMASKAYRKRIQEKLAPHGIGLAEFLHLRELWITDGLPQIEVARLIGIEKASSTKALLSLEAKGLIRRTRNTADRRIINLFLTEAGRGLKEEIVPVALGVSMQAIKGFSDDEVKLIVGYLETITSNILEE